MKIGKIILSAGLALVLGLACAACGEKKYKVTLDYDASQGTLSLSAPEQTDEREFAADTELTVSVTPGEGYELDAFTVNGAAETPDGGKYSFVLSEDTTIAATFRLAEEDGPRLSFPQGYRGTWKTYGVAPSRTITMVINSYSLKATDAQLNPQTIAIDPSPEEGYLLDWDGKTYTLRRVSEVDCLLVLSDGEKNIYYLKEGTGSVSVPERFYGTYLGTKGMLTVGETVVLGTEEFDPIAVDEKTDRVYALADDFYTFAFDGDEVSVTPYGGAPASFSRDNGPDLGVGVSPYWVGVWTEVGGDRELTFTSRAVSLGGETPAALESTEGGYAFDLDGVHYETSWYGYIPGVILVLRTGSEGNYEYACFLGARYPAFGAGDAFESRYYRGDSGTSFLWHEEGGGGSTLAISAGEVAYDGETPDLIVDAGYLESFIDPLGGDPIYVQAHCYYLFFGETVRFLYWQPTTKSPIVAEDFLGSDYNVRKLYNDGIVRLPAEWWGDWNSLSDGSVMTVEERAVLFDGADAGLMEGNGGVTVLWKGQRYLLGAYSDSGEIQTFLTLEEIVEDPLTQTAAVFYFLNAKLAGRSVPVASALDGTWKSDSGEDIVISDGTLAWADRRVQVLSESHEGPNYTYKLIVGDQVCQIDYGGGIRMTVSLGYSLETFLRYGEIAKGSGSIPAEYRGVYYGGFTAIAVEAEKIAVSIGTVTKEYRVGDTASTSVVKVEREGNEVKLYFLWEETETDDGDIEVSSLFATYAAAAGSRITQVCVTLRLEPPTPEEGEALWSEYGEQDGEAGYQPQYTLNKSTRF